MTVSFAGFAGEVDKEEWARLVRAFGYESVVQGLTVDPVAGQPRTVRVNTGWGNVGGVIGEVTAAENKQAGTNVSAFTRIDRIVLKADWNANTLTLIIKAGTPSANPQPPSLTKQLPWLTTAGVWEMSLAQLTVAPGQGDFLAGQIDRDSTPTPTGFYRIAELLRAPDPDVNPALIWYTADKSLRVADDGEYVEVAHARGLSQPVEAESATAIAAFNSASGLAGSPQVEVSFPAPPSGKVYITVGGRITANVEGGQTILSWQLRKSNNDVVQEPITNHGIVCGEEADTGAPTRLGASKRKLWEGLTPGDTYKVRTMHYVSGGSGTCQYRSILVEPVLS